MLSVSWPLADLTLRIPDVALYSGLACTLASLVWWCARLERKTKLSSRRVASSPWLPVPDPQADQLADNAQATDLEERLGARISPSEARYFQAFESRTGRTLSSQPGESSSSLLEQRRWVFLKYLIDKGLYNEFPN